MKTWTITIWRSQFADNTWRKTYSTCFEGYYDEALAEAKKLIVYKDEKFTIES